MSRPQCEAAHNFYGRCTLPARHAKDHLGYVDGKWDNEGPQVDAAPGLYWWVRDVDEAGMSGAGRVAQVAVFLDGSAVLRWLAEHNTAGVGSTVCYATLQDLVWVHGHGEKCTGHLESA